MNLCIVLLLNTIQYNKEKHLSGYKSTYIGGCLVDIPSIEDCKMSVYDVIRDRLLEAIDTTGNVPWKKMWSCRSGGPLNVVSGKNYRGVNILLLSGANSPYFGTFKQWKEMGCTLKSGVKPYACVFYTQVRRTEEQEKKYNGHMPRAYSLLRYYNVFNADDVNLSDAAAKRIATLNEKNEKSIKFNERSDYKIIADEIVKLSGVTVKYGDPACYRGMNVIAMPEFNEFDTEYEFLVSLCHEMIHLTGHKEHLNRSVDNSYAYEECIAEIGGVMLTNALGIEINDTELKNNAAYVKHWTNKLRTDEKCVNMIIKASSDAQKACDYVLERMNVVKE